MKSENQLTNSPSEIGKHKKLFKKQWTDCS
jgi:hypothetical protein